MTLCAIPSLGSIDPLWGVRNDLGERHSCLPKNLQEGWRPWAGRSVKGERRAARLDSRAGPKSRRDLNELGYCYISGSAEKLAAFLNSKIAKWAELARDASLK